MQQNLNACECISPKDKDTNVFLLIVAQFFPYTGPNSKIHSPRNPDYVPQNIHLRYSWSKKVIGAANMTKNQLF